MSRIPKPTNRESPTQTGDNANQHRFDDGNKTNEDKTNGTVGRSSRIITLVGLFSLAAIMAAVLLTSERNGPGSQRLTITTAPIAPTGNAADTADADVFTGATQPDTATNCVATETMPGGDNFYVPNAPAVENLGTGLVVQGTVQEAGTCAPVRNTRIQVWLTTARGGEGEPSNRGSVMTDENGRYRLETSPVVAQFGQPHVHIAYDDGDYRSLFLRAVMESENISSFTVDFVLEPNDE